MEVISMKRKLCQGIAGLLCAVSMIGCVPAFAVEAVPVLVSAEQTTSSTMSTFAIEYEWVYYLIDGVYYKRKWNSTYGRWETDYIRCG